MEHDCFSARLNGCQLRQTETPVTGTARLIRVKDDQCGAIERTSVRQELSRAGHCASTANHAPSSRTTRPHPSNRDSRERTPGIQGYSPSGRSNARQVRVPNLVPNPACWAVFFCGVFFVLLHLWSTCLSRLAFPANPASRLTRDSLGNRGHSSTFSLKSAIPARLTMPHASTYHAGA